MIENMMNAENMSQKQIVLLACGAFNPITRWHIKMFDLGRNALLRKWNCQVVEGVLSPAADAFGKKELASATHRLKMIELATETSSWIRGDAYESSLKEWSRTLNVLRHHQTELNRTHGQNAHVMLLCGADLIDTFSRILDNGQPLWTPEHVEEIIRDFGIVAINRIGATAMETLSKLKLRLSPEQMSNVILVDDFEKEDVSSTMVRQRVKQGQPITDLTFEKVVNYIRDNHLYEATT
ncbi:cytidylyltransferase-like domain-containing protein [Ditylenchus destructor]|uniref:Nicotinamide-nucleotide adenylyltransferase n=1 Tax=Ditylenchus destructor TaxID=166010 RepID=A0AAD4NBM0_9BILA|nr:cytidylyltransferase-like domain-containing protein [Ditylenchus destructor]